jgi:hypothetical protein
MISDARQLTGRLNDAPFERLCAGARVKLISPERCHGR